MLVFILGCVCGFIPAYIIGRSKNRRLGRQIEQFGIECGEVRALAEACAQTIQISRWEQQMTEFMEGQR